MSSGLDRKSVQATRYATGDLERISQSPQTERPKGLSDVMSAEVE